MVLRKCGLVNSYFVDKNGNIFSLQVKKIDEEVIDIGGEVQVMEPW